ncbi:MAG: hypothetical protein IJT44_05355 [Clostridia bacterium]|nr:hypothetical protein [Clostridia bacterium]
MKRITAILLAVCFTVSLFVLPAHAQTNASQTADCEYVNIFVTGIGQTWTHLLDENGEQRVNRKSDRKHYNLFYDEDDLVEYNIFYLDSSTLREPRNALAALRILGQTLRSVLTQHNCVQKRDLKTIVRAVCHYHIPDANGELPADVEPVVRPYPFSEYNAQEMHNVYRSIPCEDMVEAVGAENFYCYNYPAFSSLYSDAQKLDDFIQTVKKQTGKDKVVLTPMSMGAAVVSAYLDAYGDKGDVKRVVSIVGAWNGSDVFADLIEKKFAADSPQLLYRDILRELLKTPGCDILSLALRMVPKQELRAFINDLVDALCEELIFKSSSLLALIPYERYEAIEREYLSDPQYAAIRAETRRYYEAQRTLKQRLSALEAQGTEFYFLAGYGLPFGAADFPYFAFMKSTETTNSDEVIGIASTAPGAEYAPCGKSLGRTGEYVSPDGSVDLSTSFAPDRTWCFYQQKHGLEYNNTALRLAFDIACGKVRNVRDSAQTYPQFNKARDLKPIRGVPEKLRTFIRENADDASKAHDVELARDALRRCEEMIADTHNDPARDGEVMAYAQQVLYEIGVDTPEQPQELTGFSKIMRWLSDRAYTRFGPAGFADIFKK